MNQPFYETFHEISPQGIALSYLTFPGGHHPLHWHEELELLYPLNGEADIVVEGKKHRLLKRHLMAVESRQVHGTHAYKGTSMFICIHISKRYMQTYLPDIDLYRIHCIPEDIGDERFPEYHEICRLMETLTRLYMVEDIPTFTMESEGIILQVLSRLLRFFSEHRAPRLPGASVSAFDRLRTILAYVGAHYREPITLQDAAGVLGFTRVYFCRFFKKNMGLPFLEYLGEVRASHIYQDLLHSDEPVSLLMERHGFTNQKLFNKTFKKLYGCTPSAARKAARQTESSAAH